MSGGLMFGLLAAVLDSATDLLSQQGIAGALTHWQPYLLAIIAPAGELFAQSAYQSGPLSVSLPILYVFEPGVAIAIGIAAFGEHVTHTPVSIGIEAIGLAAVVMGIVTLDHAS